MTTQLFFEDERDPENCITITKADNGKVVIAVAEERAMDSYNETFECTFILDEEQAKQLKSWLNGAING